MLGDSMAFSFRQGLRCLNRLSRSNLGSNPPPIAKTPKARCGIHMKFPWCVFLPLLHSHGKIAAIGLTKILEKFESKHPFGTCGGLPTPPRPSPQQFLPLGPVGPMTAPAGQPDPTEEITRADQGPPGGKEATEGMGGGRGGEGLVGRQTDIPTRFSPDPLGRGMGTELTEGGGWLRGSSFAPAPPLRREEGGVAIPFELRTTIIPTIHPLRSWPFTTFSGPS